MIIDEFKTIEGTSTGEYKEKGSKFVAYAFPVKTEEDIQLALTQVKEEHFKARHHCYAYQLGIDGDSFRTNDDGEPSGTAGKPIYGQILSHELTDIVIVVVRYFGGTKLGVSGLINAYKDSAKEAISNAVIITKYISQIYELTFDYDRMGEILDIIKSLDLNITSKEFTDRAIVQVEIRKSVESEEIVRLKSTLLKVSPEYVDIDTDVEHCSIKLIGTND